MNDQERETQPSGRSVGVRAFGDTANEIELDALDKAREFFGGEPQLQIVPDYRAADATHFGGEAKGKKYYAHVDVRTVEKPPTP